MPASFPYIKTFEGTSSAVVAAATEITLQCARLQKDVEIVRVQVKRLSGTAATYQPMVGNSAGFTTGTVAEKFKATTTAVADMVDTTNIMGYCQTDANGKLYFRFTPNAGADNQFDYSITVRVF